MSIKINEELDRINTELGSVGTGSLSGLGSENQSLLGILSSRVGGVINSVGADKWDCKIKDEIQSFVSGTVTESINKAIQSSQFVSDSVGHVENLKTICNQYVTEFGKYETELKKTGIKRYEDEEKTKETREYKNWLYTINAYERSLPKLEDEALRVKQEVANYFASVDFTTNTSDSKIFSAGATDIKIDYEEYFNGELKAIKEEYEVKKEEIKTNETTGDVTYEQEYKVEKEFADGTKVIGEGTETLEIKNNKGKASDEVKNASSIISKTNKDLASGIENLDEEETVDLDAEEAKQLNEVISEPFVHKVREEGTIESIDDKKQEYVYDKEEDQDGLVHENIIVTDTETQQSVYEEQEDRTANYQDGFEIDTKEYMKDEKTEATRTRSITRTYTAGENTTADQLVFNENANDSTCGTVVEESGEKYTYYRDDSGVLHETYDNGNGYVSEDVVDEDSSSIYMFTVTDASTGETSSYPINVYSRLDRAKMLYDMTSARRDCGYNDESGSSLTALEMTREFEVEGQDGKKYLFKIENK